MSSKRSIAVFLFVSVSVFFTDQLTKWIFFRPAFEEKLIIANVLEFILHKNSGISFNIPIPRFLTIITTLVVLIGILYLIRINRAMQLRTMIGLALVFGGALGNMLDRIVFDYVRDWLLFFGRSAINLADFCILLGMLFYFIGETLFRNNKEPQTLDRSG